jgi:hypothetical protein
MTKFAKKCLNGLFEFIGRISTRIFATIFGVLWFSMGAYVASNNWTSINTWESGIGKVVGHGEPRRSVGHRKVLFWPSCIAFIEFKKDDGTIHQFRTRVGYKTCPYKLGEELPILFSETEANKGVINSTSEIWLAPTVSLMLATVFGTIGLFGKRIKAFFVP